ncbi:hypothetical protein [Demequina aestuarii]|uniref:hypothetical protein n=1 Tax=Demequina aestuarii TaxID=327095 RepID=UPI0007807937|nr:hypothetical protein [Demequina aestuarii]
MKAADAVQYLDTLGERFDILESGLRGDVAYARLGGDVPGRRTAVVNSPGERWFEVAVDDGFAYTVFAEDVDDSEVRQLLDSMAELATCYVVEGGEVERPRSFSPRLAVQCGGQRVVFRRSLVEDLKRFAQRIYPSREA